MNRASHSWTKFERNFCVNLRLSKDTVNLTYCELVKFERPHWPLILLGAGSMAPRQSPDQRKERPKASVVG